MTAYWWIVPLSIGSFCITSSRGWLICIDQVRTYGWWRTDWADTRETSVFLVLWPILVVVAVTWAVVGLCRSGVYGVVA
jgi:hypothetical protein